MGRAQPPHLQAIEECGARKKPLQNCLFSKARTPREKSQDFLAEAPQSIKHTELAQGLRQEAFHLPTKLPIQRDASGAVNLRARGASPLNKRLSVRSEKFLSSKPGRNMSMLTSAFDFVCEPVALHFFVRPGACAAKSLRRPSQRDRASFEVVFDQTRTLAKNVRFPGRRSKNTSPAKGLRQQALHLPAKLPARNNPCIWEHPHSCHTHTLCVTHDTRNACAQQKDECLHLGWGCRRWDFAGSGGPRPWFWLRVP